jgi:AraC-like DNA-binding protein/mannose-6-phosphate isomerase-like protein (cupin superfamily)
MDMLARILYEIDMSKIPPHEQGGGRRWENIHPDPVFSKVSFHVLCAYRTELDATWRCEFRRTHYDRLYFVEDGAALLEFDDEALELTPGRLYLIPANTLHRHSCPRRVVISWCHFQAEAEGGADLFELLRIPRSLSPAAPERAASDFADLARAMEIRHGWGMLRRANLLLTLLMPFLRAADESAFRATRSRYLPVLQFIDAHLADPLTLDMLAGRIGRSAEHFCRSFSRDFHLPPMRYVMRKRIQVAQRLLCRTDLKHHEIGERCGFPDPYHFSKAFKRLSGTTPTEYRRHYREGV